MPKVSSIIQRRKDEDTAEEALQNLALTSNPYHDENDAWQRLVESPDVFSIFTLAMQFNIPVYDLPRLHGVRPRERDIRGETPQVFTLGSGFSCHVIALDTDDSMSDIWTRVAMKRYKAKPSGTESEETVTKKLYQWLSQELKTFCHPQLRNHENINKLYFIAWEEGNFVPSLGLELASYGTLEDCLHHLRCSESSQRKCHLSFDIALGIAALGSLGLVHGDVKPGNVIICPHPYPERGIIAKISDLNGVAFASNYDSKQFVLVGTPLWQPPEVLRSEGVVDWHLADVYAYGMILATLWSTKGYIPPGGTFVDPGIQFSLNAEQKQAVMEFYKLNPDYETTGMTQLALTLLPMEEVGIPLRDIINASLSNIPDRRMSIFSILHTHFQEFATKTRRHMSLDSARPNPSMDLDATYWASNSIDSLLVLHPKFIARSSTFKRKMFQALLSSGESLRRALPLHPGQEIDENFEGSDEELMDLLKEDNRLHKKHIFDDSKLHRLGNMALNISMSYLLGIGTQENESEAMDWLRIAADAGEGNATYWFGPLEQSVQNSTKSQLPRKKWSAMGVLHGFSSDALFLKVLDEGLYGTAVRMACRRRWGRDSPQIVRIEPYMERIISPIKANAAIVDEKIEARYGAEDIGEQALHACVAIGDMALTRYLVFEARANINVTNDRNETPIFYAARAGQPDIVDLLLKLEADVSQISTEGLNILHCLTYMDDEKAAHFAPILVDRGAKLTQSALESPGDRKDNFVLGAGTPMFWAALKGKRLLLEALVKLHSKPGQQITPAEYCLFVQAMAVLNMHSALAIVLKAQSLIFNRGQVFAQTHTTRQICERFSILNLCNLENGMSEAINSADIHVRYYSLALYHALDTRPLPALHRRYIHMTGFRQAKEETIKLLLNAGADQLVQRDSADPSSTPLSLAVYTGDVIALRLLITDLEARKVDVLSSLSNNMLFGRYSALQRAIYNDAKELFLFLVDNYPDLMKLRGDQGRQPLHSAATQTWPGYAKVLLKHGSNPHERADDRSTPFTWALMRSPTFESAKEISGLMANDANMDELLGPDIKTGFTAFGKLISGLTYWKMDFGIDRIQFLVDTYGKPSIYANEHNKTTVFRSLLGQLPP